ncbi:2-oxoacid:acceptor oxidoreductase subunit alpha [Clostridia bacterium OttesenSCG-928-O13]|nr:2-oxoacid:acceptor oxidoreductase subunit alpha [Clostridia bacterium OttesenSCG-928-O13]
MVYNLLIGGAAGDGIETMAGVFEKILKRKGFYLFSMRDFMSRVRGGHNFAKIRFGAKPVRAHRDKLDGLVVFNEESFTLHQGELARNGFVLHDEDVQLRHKNAVPLAMKELAKESGNAKTVGTVCAGAMLQLFGLGIDMAEDVLKESLPPKILDANLKALRLGYEAVAPRFSIKPGKKAETMLLTGADAMALGALAGGLQFYSAYPMSPSTTLLEFFTKHSEDFRIGVEQAEDEIAAVNMALGAATAGARAMTGTSGGGFSLMVEALGFAGIAEIPVVLADIMRPGPSTGLPTRTEQSDLQFVIHASQGEFPRMVIALRDHEDAFYQTARAFRLAWQYQIPVILLSDQYLADSAATIPPLDGDKARQMAALPAGTVETGKPSGEYKRYALTKSGVSPLRFPGKSAALVRVDSDEHDERGTITEAADVRTAQVDKRARKLKALQKELQEPSYTGPKQPELLLVGFGTTAPALAEAVKKLNKQPGTKAGALCFGDVWPLPTKTLKRLAKTAKHVVNVEQTATGQLASLLRSQALVDCDTSILKYDGRQLSVDDIVSGVQKLKLERV